MMSLYERPCATIFRIAIIACSRLIFFEDDLLCVGKLLLVFEALPRLCAL
jgi:hypothetical protein